MMPHRLSRWFQTTIERFAAGARTRRDLARYRTFPLTDEERAVADLDVEFDLGERNK